MKCNRKKPEECFSCPYPDCIENKMKSYDPDKNKEYCRTYYQRHKEQIIKRVREYQEKNREKKLAYNRAYQKAHYNYKKKEAAANA